MSRRAHNPRRENAVRAIAALLALIFVGGQIGSYQHLAEAQHARCDEHGELIDLPSHDAPVPTLQRHALAEHRETQIACAAHIAGDHRHDHCVLAPHRRGPAVTDGHARHVAVLPPLDQLIASTSDSPSLGKCALFRLAPKNSPPA